MNHSHNKQRAIFWLLSMHVMAVLSPLFMPIEGGSSFFLFGKPIPIASVLAGVMALSTWWVSCLAAHAWGIGHWDKRVVFGGNHSFFGFFPSKYGGSTLYPSFY